MFNWKKSLCLMMSSVMFMGTTANASAPISEKLNANAIESTTKSDDSAYIKNYTKINGISDSTILGADFSEYQQNLAWKKVYYDYKGNTISNLFTFMKEQGVNTISVKVAVNPTGTLEYYSLENAMKTIKAAKEAGLNTNMVLMYSDEITYANLQTLPQGWSTTDAADKAKSYTEDVLSKLEAANTLPTMITIGNELNYDFLGITSAGGWDGWLAMGQISQLVKAKGVKVAVGLASVGAADDVQWVLEKLNDPATGIEYDSVGVTLYPDSNTLNYMETMRTTFNANATGKQLFVSSVKYPRVSDTDTTVGNESQAENIYKLLSATIDDKNAGGLCYAEAAFVGSWNSFFDVNGNAQTSLAIFGYAQGKEVDVDTFRNPYQYGGDTGLKDEQVSIKKIANMSESAIRGMDIGSYIALKEAGVKYYDYNGKEQSLLKILHDNGVNYIRIRIWNDPKNEKGETYGGGNCDVATGLKIANEAKKYGMKISLCFHYSDFWADPAQQIVPKAWQKDVADQKKMAQNVYNFTKDTVQQFKDAGAEIGMVQVGNEITNGLLGMVADRDKGGNYYEIWGNKTTSAKINSYLSAGSKAVREVAPEALIALHLETANVTKYTNIMNTWERDGVDYDVLGSSYYPYWSVGAKANTPARMIEVQNLAAKKGKLFAIMETAWVNSLEDADGTPNSIGAGHDTSAFKVGAQGQVDSLTELYETTLSQENGLGAFYWEPAWLPVVPGWANWEVNKETSNKLGTGWAAAGAVGYFSDYKMFYQGEPAWGGTSWDNQSLFDTNGHALQSLKFYKDSISAGIEQTSMIHLVDVNGKEIAPARFAKVYEGSTRNFTIPKVSGYVLQNQATTLKLTGEADGVKHYYIKYLKTPEIKTKKSSYKLDCGNTLNFAKELTISSKGTVKYSSSNSKVVAVDAKTGKITAKSVGKATITVSVAKTASDTAATKKINVTVAPKVVLKNKGVQTFAYGSSYKLSNYATITGSCTKKFTSSNKSIAKVDSKGNITAVKPGKATITMKVSASGMDTITKKVTVNVVPKKQKISKVTAASKALTVNFKKDSKASGYQVMVSTDKNFKSNTKSVYISKNSTVKTTVKKLSKKKQYYVRVRSYKTISNKKCYGSWSSVSKMKTK